MPESKRGKRRRRRRKGGGAPLFRPPFVSALYGGSPPSVLLLLLRPRLRLRHANRVDHRTHSTAARLLSLPPFRVERRMDGYGCEGGGRSGERRRRRRRRWRPPPPPPEMLRGEGESEAISLPPLLRASPAEQKHLTRGATAAPTKGESNQLSCIPPLFLLSDS